MKDHGKKGCEEKHKKGVTVKMSSIIGLHAREILDSRGNPTIETEIWLESGVISRAAVPSGASTGTYEAVELRDGGERFMGKGVQKAVTNVNEVIAPEIVGLDPVDQGYIDNLMIDLDGTENKEVLGANAILSVSMAIARAASLEHDLPLWSYLGGLGPFLMPTPFMNVINGGEHADNNLDIQEFMIVPHGADSIEDAIRMGVETYHCLKKNLKHQGLSTGLGDEGGFAPNLDSNRQALDIIIQSIQSAGYQPGSDISLALDVAATEIYKEGKYLLSGENKQLSASGMIDYYKELCGSYPIISIEDGMAEEDWDGWKLLMSKLGSEIQVVGDDLFVTNKGRLSKGINEGSANSILIKLNQIGTVTETLEVIRLASNKGFSAMISHRSGETADSFISDLAVAMSVGQIKTGAPARVDRIEKYNQLLRISEVSVEGIPFASLEMIKCRK